MTALPAGHTARAATWDDLPVVLALVQAVDIATLGEADTTSEDLRSEWSLPRFHPEDGALVQRAFVGDLAGIDGRQDRHQHRARDAVGTARGLRRK